MLDRATRALAATADRPRRIAEEGRALRRATLTRYPIAQTPKEVVWTLNKARLYRYATPEHVVRRGRPLLLVYALMNRPSILDLRRGGSFVEYMVGRGHDVFLIDWGAPGPEDAGLSFDDYVLEYLPRAIRKLKRVSGHEDFDVLGWCIGAILSLSYAALRPNDGLAGLVLLTAPLDHTRRGASAFSRQVDAEAFDVELLLARYGNMPGALVQQAAKNLRPVENHLTTYLRLAESAGDERAVDAWHAMTTWLNDNIDMTGAFYRQLVTQIYNENRLFNGTLELRGERVRLDRVRASVLNVLAEEDHLVAPCQSETILPALGSEDVTQLRVPGGHIGMMAGSRAVHETWPRIEDWLTARL